MIRSSMYEINEVGGSSALLPFRFLAAGRTLALLGVCTSASAVVNDDGCAGVSVCPGVRNPDCSNWREDVSRVGMELTN